MAEKLGKRNIFQPDMTICRKTTLKAAMEYGVCLKADQSTLIKKNRQSIITLKHISNNFLKKQ